MKKATLIIALLFSVASFGQKDSAKVKAPAQDTLVHTIMTVDQYRQVMYALNQLIDSKQKTSEILGFIQQHTSIYQPADKPKQPKK